MHYFLAKTDPKTYSVEQFAQEETTLWDGVRNAQAVQAIKAMRKGDRVFIYHSLGQAAIVGLAEVRQNPQPDPNNAKSAVVELHFLQRLEPPTTLGDIKASGKFSEWALVRQSRLSTMAAPNTFVSLMRKRYPGIRL